MLIDNAYNNGVMQNGSINNVGEAIGGAINNLNGTTQKMRWEELMRDTQYQTAVADMKKAGINPAMMYQSGGNGAGVPSAPGGGSFKTSIPEMLGATAGIINSVTNARKVDIISNQNELSERTAKKLYDKTATIAGMLARFMA